MNILKRIGALFLVGAAGLGIGYFYAPDKVKVVEKEKIVREEIVKETVRYDPKTGKITEKVTEKGTKETTDTKKSSEKEKTRKQFAAKAGVAVAVRDPGKYIPRVGAEVRLPFFDSWAGVEVDLELQDPKLGAYLRLEF